MLQCTARLVEKGHDLNIMWRVNPVHVGASCGHAVGAWKDPADWRLTWMTCTAAVEHPATEQLQHVRMRCVSAKLANPMFTSNSCERTSSLALRHAPDQKYLHCVSDALQPSGDSDALSPGVRGNKTLFGHSPELESSDASLYRSVTGTELFYTKL